MPDTPNGDSYRYQELVQGLPVAVYMCDSAGLVTLYNEAAVELWGRRPMPGDRWSGSFRIYNPDGTPMDLDKCPMAQAIQQGQAVAGKEIIIERPDGQRRWVTPHPQPLHDDSGALIGAVNMLVDITDRKLSEEVLKKAKEAAEAASRAKDRFLAVLSHELRTPLTPVLMAVTAMQDDPGLPETLRREISMIYRNVELEAKLIDDLLDLNRITSGKLRLRLEATDLNIAVEHVCQICRPQIQEKGIGLHVSLASGLLPVSADAARLRQVLWNVMKNAVKFTPQGGMITIATSCVADRARVTVQDNGIGITFAQLPHIFDAFNQGDENMPRHFGGVGLGLAISKALIELQGGSIRAISAGKDEGATFIIELPLKQRARVPEQPHQPLNAANQGLRVLIVEDHADTARMLAQLLCHAGYFVKTADCVAAALDLVASEHFDVLVSDLGLPDATGYELMEQLRSRYTIKGIAMSGYGMDEDIRKGREAGFSEHLVKPVDVAQLAQAIGRVTSLRDGSAAAAPAVTVP